MEMSMEMSMEMPSLYRFIVQRVWIWWLLQSNAAPPGFVRKTEF